MKKMMVGLAVCALVFSGCNLSGPDKQAMDVDSQQQMKGQDVILVFDFDGKLATYSSQIQESSTALSVLEEVGEEEQLDVVVKEYDFGVLVESVDGMENSAERAWIYFVNGSTGDVGADQKELKPGDVVEWKYIEPIY